MVWQYICSEYRDRYKGEIKRCIGELKQKDTAFKQIPNLLTSFRAFSMIPVNILFLLRQPILGIILAVVALLTDFFDGKIARKYNIQSKFGADLDAVCDKIVFLGLSLPLSFTNLAIFVNLFLEGLIAYVNIRGRMNGRDTSTVFAGKVKTWILSITLIIGYLTSFLNLPMIFFSSLITLGVLSQSYTLVRYISVCQEPIDMVSTTENALREEVMTKKNSKENSNNLVDALRKERDFLLDSQVIEETRYNKKSRKKGK